MPAGITGAPQSYPVGVDSGVGFQIGDGIAPIGDLTPRINVTARLPAASPEPAMVVDQNHETGLRVHPCEVVQAVFAYAREAVGHRDRGVWPRPVRDKQPRT